MNYDTSGKKRLEPQELACGLHRILRSHGNGEGRIRRKDKREYGERTKAKVDDIFQIGRKVRPPYD